MYLENVVSYIAGFVIATLKKKIVCKKCVDALCDQSSTTCLDDCQQYDLINVKNRGGLQKPAVDVVKIWKTGRTGILQICKPNETASIISKHKRCIDFVCILTDMIGTDTFRNLNETLLKRN